MQANCTINERLDKILEFLYLKYKNASPHEDMIVELSGGAKFMDGSSVSKYPFIRPKGDEVYLEISDIYNGLNYPKISVRNDLELLLSHLIKNDMISLKTRVGKLPIYRISFEGAVFIENGGYTAQRRQKKIQDRLRQVQTIALVGGTVGGGIVGIYSLFSNPVTGSIVVAILLSMLAALIVPLIASQAKHMLSNKNRTNE